MKYRFSLRIIFLRHTLHQFPQYGAPTCNRSNLLSKITGTQVQLKKHPQIIHQETLPHSGDLYFGHKNRCGSTRGHIGHQQHGTPCLPPAHQREKSALSLRRSPIDFWCADVGKLIAMFFTDKPENLPGSIQKLANTLLSVFSSALLSLAFTFRNFLAKEPNPNCEPSRNWLWLYISNQSILVSLYYCLVDIYPKKTEFAWDSIFTTTTQITDAASRLLSIPYFLKSGMSTAKNFSSTG